jgi:hypothetical protein
MSTEACWCPAGSPLPFPKCVRLGGPKRFFSGAAPGRVGTAIAPQLLHRVHFGFWTDKVIYGLLRIPIVGLDLSLSSSGFHTLGTSNSGAISPGKLGEIERIDFILARVAELVREGDFVVVENNAFNALGSAKSKLAELNGIVKFWLWRRGIPYVLVARPLFRACQGLPSNFFAIFSASLLPAGPD